LEISDIGLESVIEPTTKIVVTGARAGLTEEGGDLVIDFEFIEDRERGG